MMWFYNSKRRHGSNGQRSPLDYEKANQKMVMCVQNFGGYSLIHKWTLKGAQPLIVIDNKWCLTMFAYSCLDEHLVMPSTGH